MKIQAKILSVMGSLTKPWSFTDGALNSNEDKLELIMKDLNELVEQSKTMSGQAFNNFSYNERMQTLSSFLNDNQAKHLFKDKEVKNSKTIDIKL